MAVRQAVYDERVWAALIVNANATALLRRAVETVTIRTIVYNQAQDKTTYGNYIIPMIAQLETQITSQFSEMWASQVLSSISLPKLCSLEPQRPSRRQSASQHTISALSFLTP